MSDEFINITVAQRGAQSVRRDIEGIGTGADVAARSVGLLSRALGILGVGFGLSQLQQAVDGYTNLSNRLRLVSTDTANLGALQEAVFQAAQRTRTSYASLAQLYARTALNAANLGLSQAGVLQITEQITQALKIGGATAAEANGTIIQFTQSLASGTLRGQELNSVLKDAPRLAKAIADGMGVGVGQLKELGKQGKITTQVIVEALKKAAPELNAEFAKIKPTIDDAFTVLYNGFQRTIGQLNDATGASTLFANALIAIGSNTTLMAAGLTLLAGLLVTVMIPAIVAATVATWTFTAALLANPIGLIVTGVVLAGAALVAFGDQIKITGDGAVTLLDWFKSLFSFIIQWSQVAGGAIFQWLGGAWEKVRGVVQPVVDYLRDNMGNIGNLAFIVYQTWAGLFTATFEAIIAIFENLPAALEGIFKSAMNGVIEIVQNALNGIEGAINGLLEKVHIPALPPVDLSAFKQSFSKEAQDLPGTISSAVIKGFNDGVAGADALKNNVIAGLDAINDRARGIANNRSWQDLVKPNGSLPNTSTTGSTAGADAGKPAKLDAFDKALRSVTEQTAGLKAQAEALGLNVYQSTKLAEVTKLNNKAAEDGIGLTPQRVADIDRVSSAYAQQKDQLDKLNIVYQTGKDIVTGFAADLVANTRKGETFWQALGDAATSAMNKIEDKLIDLTTSAAWDALWSGGGVSGSGSGGGLSSIISSVIGLFTGKGSTGIGLGQANGFGSSYATGGFTGNGANNQIAGAVHKNEYVFDAGSVRRIGRSALDALRNGLGYMDGGYVSGPSGYTASAAARSSAPSGFGGVSVQIVNQTGSEVKAGKTTATRGPDGSTVLKVTIVSAVKTAIADGSLDASMNAVYGLQRRGG